MRWHRIASMVFALLVFTLATGADEPRWTDFRGPDRSGVSPETGLLDAWPPEGPPVLWRRTIGEGFSGVVVSGERFFTLFAAEDGSYVGAFRVADGEEVWRTRIAEEAFTGDFGRGPRATPVLAGDVVYALAARGGLLAASAADGKPLWTVDLFEKYGFFGPQWTLRGEPPGTLQMPLWGYSYTPLVEGDLVFVETGAGKGRSYVAFDRRTGEERWTASDHPIGYSSPLAATLAGRRQIVAVADHDLLGMTPGGDVLWRLPWAPTVAQVVHVPPDRVFVSTVALGPYEGGAMLVEVRAGEDGGVRAEPVWRSQAMRVLWAAPVYYQGRIYGFDNATFRCLRAADGEPLWAKRGLGKCTLVAADGHLILFSDQGVLRLAEAGGEGYVEKGRVKLFDAARTWTPPTIAGGRLYVRAGTELVALDLRAPEAEEGR